jgi:hypothetical protein
MRRLNRTIAGLAFGLAAVPAAALEITAPAPDAVVTPGSSVTVKAVAAAGQTFTDVVFFIPGTDPKTTAELVATLKVPTEAVGPLPIVVMGTTPAGDVESATVMVTVEPGTLERLTVAAPDPLTHIGQIVDLDVRGLFADGVTRDLSGSARGTTYATSNGAVLGIHPEGVIQARSRGRANVTATNRGKSLTFAVDVVVPDPPNNRIPVADAGPDQAAVSETRVDLTASGSTDADGDALTYRWIQMSGPLIFVWNDTSAHPHFVAPNVSQPTVIEFSLVVEDGKGATAFPDTVSITVNPTPPAVPQA